MTLWLDVLVAGAATPASREVDGMLERAKLGELLPQWPQVTPALKQRTALLRRLKEEFRRWDSQPVGRVIAVINPILRGWVNYFRVGHASRCFTFVKDWIEKKVRRPVGAKDREGPFMLPTPFDQQYPTLDEWWEGWRKSLTLADGQAVQTTPAGGFYLFGSDSDQTRAR